MMTIIIIMMMLVGDDDDDCYYYLFIIIIITILPQWWKHMWFLNGAKSAFKAQVFGRARSEGRDGAGYSKL